MQSTKSTCSFNLARNKVSIFDTIINYDVNYDSLLYINIHVLLYLEYQSNGHQGADYMIQAEKDSWASVTCVNETLNRWHM